MHAINLGTLKVPQCWSFFWPTLNIRVFLPQTSTLLRYADVYNINIRSDCSQAELLAAVRK